MTNDELEAVRARASKAKAAEWDSQWGETHVLVAKSQADIPALLDEVERLGKLFVDTRGRGHWLTEEEHARATRAEAHAERLKATMREISATILAGMEPDPPYCESCKSAGETQVLLVVEKVAALVSQALSAYRSKTT